DGWPDGDRGLIIASALGGIVHFDQQIGQEEVRLEIPGVRSLHALEKSDRIPRLESDLPRDEPQEGHGLALDRRRPGELLERMRVVPQSGTANPPAGWVRLNLPCDLEQPVAPAVVTRGPIVERDEQGRRDARRS